MLDRRLALDPSLVFYAPLRRLDGDAFMCRDAYGHLCTNYGSIWNIDGRKFDGVNDYVDCGDGESLNITDAITISAWIKPTTLTDHIFHVIVTKRCDTSWDFSLYQQTGKLQLWVAGTSHYSDSEINVDEWSHVVVTWDGSVIKYFINGIYLTGEDDAATGVGLTDNYSVGIGIGFEYSPNAYQFNGSIDEVRIYGRALSSSEGQRLYERGRRKC